MYAAFDPAPHQPGFLQRFDVLGGPGEGHVEGGGELADTALTSGEALENGPPGGIRQRVKHGVQMCALLFNHMV